MPLHADEWLKLQLPAPQRLKITDLHLEQLQPLQGQAADALQGYIEMTKHIVNCAALTSLQFTFCRHSQHFRVRPTLS